MTSYSPTFLQLTEEKYNEQADSLESNLCFSDAVGRLYIELHRLVAELTLDTSEQDSEKALEILVAIAVACTCAAEDLVLPQLRGEEN